MFMLGLPPIIWNGKGVILTNFHHMFHRKLSTHLSVSVTKILSTGISVSVVMRDTPNRDLSVPWRSSTCTDFLKATIRPSSVRDLRICTAPGAWCIMHVAYGKYKIHAALSCFFQHASLTPVVGLSCFSQYASFTPNRESRGYFQNPRVQSTYWIKKSIYTLTVSCRHLYTPLFSH